MKKGEPFSITGFYKLGPLTSVQKAMSRLTKAGAITRVSKGIYVRPKLLKSLPSIKTTTSPERVAKIWAKEHGYTLVSHSMEAAYRLGFQTQAPIKTIFWTNGPSRRFVIGKAEVEVRHVTSNKVRWGNSAKGELLRGLLAIPPESLEPAMIKTASKRLSLSSSEIGSILKSLSRSATLSAWENRLKQIEHSLAA